MTIRSVVSAERVERESELSSQDAKKMKEEILRECRRLLAEMIRDRER